jgi:stearoyl-CoA desaturase (delta-9 desaturase)
MHWSFSSFSLSCGIHPVVTVKPQPLAISGPGCRGEVTYRRKFTPRLAPIHILNHTSTLSSSISHAHATTPLTKIILLALVWLPIFGIVSAIFLLWNSYVTWVDLALLLTFFTLCGYGITLGYHRMLTHKSFQAHPWLKTFLLICGSMAMQGPALHWAATHVQHHANSDEEEDPHSPLKSLWHAHAGWILDNFKPDIQRYAPALLKDPIIVAINNTWWLWVFTGLLIPTAIGGLTAGYFGQSVLLLSLIHI